MSLSRTVVVYGQCVPPYADVCEDANVLCSLTEMNGYMCQNTTASNPTGPTPLCPTGGAPHNTSWWAFVTNGGSICITISFSDCRVTWQGVQMGIYTDCSFSSAVVCNPACNGPGSYQLCGTLTACKTYYLFVDGCNGDVCDFILATTGGGPPTLGPLGLINNDPDKHMTVCLGACDECFEVNPQPGGCEPYYKWTMEGVEFGTGQIRECYPVFDQEGTFEICVEAIIGNPESGSICDKKGPQCMTVEVIKEKERRDGPRILCPEQTPKIWQGNVVDVSGEYTAIFIDNNCCEYDSIVEFIVRDPVEPPHVWWIGCNNRDCYVDAMGRPHCGSCSYPEEVPLRDATVPYECDSSYFLHQYLLDMVPKWRINCIDGMLEIDPTLLDRSCYDMTSAPPAIDFIYNWYKDGVGQGPIISNDPILIVKEQGNYCLEVVAEISYGTEFKRCVMNLGCEPFSERDLLLEQATISGDPLIACVGEKGVYYIDSLVHQPGIHYVWEVNHGNAGTLDTNFVEVHWDRPGNHRICFHYHFESCPSEQSCLDIIVLDSSRQIAGRDTAVNGLKYRLDAITGLSGIWTYQSPAGTARFKDPRDPQTIVRVSAKGRYDFKYTVNGLPCPADDEVSVHFRGLTDIPGEHERGNFTQSKNRLDDGEISVPSLMRCGQIYPIQGMSQSAYIHWVGIRGRGIISGVHSAIAELRAPHSPGIYLLIIEDRGRRLYRKICVVP